MLQYIRLKGLPGTNSLAYWTQEAMKKMKRCEYSTRSNVSVTRRKCFFIHIDHRQGYLYVQNKKNLIGSQWSKHYCQYQARSHILTMIPYSQLQGKITTTESIKVTRFQCYKTPVFVGDDAEK